MSDTDKKIQLHKNTFLGEAVEWDLKNYITKLASDMIEDYHCNTALERSLCEIIANSYGRILMTSQYMLRDEKLYEPRFRYLSDLSKELDRQNRTYLTAINTLMEIKNPQMTINLNSENTFLGENQQFNNNEKKNENIKD